MFFGQCCESRRQRHLPLLVVLPHGACDRALAVVTHTLTSPDGLTNITVIDLAGGGLTYSVV
jgi:hypothetical protein